MLNLGIRTYIEEVSNLKKEYPNNFNPWSLGKHFFCWRRSLNKQHNPLKDEIPWITFSAIDFRNYLGCKESLQLEKGNRNQLW